MNQPIFAQATDTVTLLVNRARTLWTSAVDKVTENPDSWIVSVIAAIMIFYVGRWAAKATEKLLERALTQASVDVTLRKFLCRIAHVSVLCVAVVAAIQKLGVDTTSLSAMIAAAGFAVAMALKDSLSNFASGVIIILFRPFQVGDFVEAGGTKGIVEEIHIFNTIINSPDNIKTYVPNGEITAGNISNYSRERLRRVDLVVGCGYGDDIRKVKKFLESLLVNHPLVLSDPTPVVAVSELADSSVNFVVRPWVANEDYWKVRWDLTEQVKLGFDECGFEIPFPQSSVHVYEGGSEPIEVEPINESSSGLIQPRRAG